LSKFTIWSIFEAADRLSGPVKTMRQNVSLFGKTSDKALSGIGKTAGFLKGALVGAVAAITTGAAAKAMQDFASRGDDIARNASILGLTAQAYQELSYAAKMADVEQEAFASASKKLNNSLGQLQTGTGALYTTLAKTNPQLARQLKNAKNTDDAFAMIASAIDKETNAQKRAALAQAAFGKSGQELIPMMNGLAEARKKAHSAGAIMTDEEVAAASAMDDAIKSLKVSGMGLINNVLAKVAVKLVPVVKSMTDWVAANKDLINLRIDQTFRAIGKGAGIIVKLWKSGLIPAILAGVAVFKGIQIAMVATTAAQWAWNIAMSANPIGLIILAIAALIGWLILVQKNWKDWGALMSLSMGPIGGAVLAIGQLAQNWNALNAAFKDGGFAEGMKSLGHTIMAMLLKPLYEATKLIGALTGNKTMIALSKEYAAGMNAENAAAGKYSTPVSPQAAGLESRAYSESKSTVDLNVSAAPGSSVAARQRGAAPGVSLNLGQTAPLNAGATW